MKRFVLLFVIAVSFAACRPVSEIVDAVEIKNYSITVDGRILCEFDAPWPYGSSTDYTFCYDTISKPLITGPYALNFSSNKQLFGITDTLLRGKPYFIRTWSGFSQNYYEYGKQIIRIDSIVPDTNFVVPCSLETNVLLDAFHNAQTFDSLVQPYNQGSLWYVEAYAPETTIRLKFRKKPKTGIYTIGYQSNFKYESGVEVKVIIDGKENYADYGAPIYVKHNSDNSWEISICDTYYRGKNTPVLSLSMNMHIP